MRAVACEMGAEPRLCRPCTLGLSNLRPSACLGSSQRVHVSVFAQDSVGVGIPKPNCPVLLTAMTCNMTLHLHLSLLYSCVGAARTPVHSCRLCAHFRLTHDWNMPPIASAKHQATLHPPNPRRKRAANARARARPATADSSKLRRVRELVRMRHVRDRVSSYELVRS